MGQNTEMRRFRGFGDTTFAMLGGAEPAAVQGAPLPEALFYFDVQGQTERLWRVQHFEVTEALSTPYEAVLDLASESFTDNPDLMLGRYALLQVQRDTIVRRLYGVVRRVEQRGTTGSSRLARVTVVPALWALSQRSDARIFQNVTAVEVVQAVLASAGLYAGMLQLSLTRECPRREYCVQYRETDLAFIERLLESEGITYFFRHDLDGTEALVLTDSAGAWLPVPTLDGGAVPIAGAEMVTHAVETVRNLTWMRSQRPARVTVRDFDFTRPNLVIEGVAPRRPGEPRELYEPAPEVSIHQYEGTAYTVETTRDQAQMRLEATLVSGATGQGEGLVSGMMPGALFAVTLAGGHIPDQRYLITRVTHTGDAQEELLLASERESMRDLRYHNRFDCVLVEAAYRPERKTPRPVIAGLQTATVTGPAGEEVYTDSHGRIRVRFHWDRTSARDETTSCWIRAMQGPWAGGGFGFQFLPRVGMEVAVTFIEGDPDRPVVIGALFNGLEVPPYELPAQRTRSGIRTQSVGGAGHNELSFEDSAGSEELRVHAQRNLDETVRNDRTTHVGGAHKTRVEGEVVFEGARNASASLVDGVTLRADRVAVSTSNDHEVAVGRDLRVSVSRARIETVRESFQQSVEGSHTAQVQGYSTQFVGHDRDLTVQGDDLEAVWGDRNVEVRGDLVERVAGASRRLVDGEVTLTSRGTVNVRADVSLTLTCGQSVIEMTRDEVVIRSPSVLVEGGERARVTSKRASLSLDGGDAKLDAASDLDLRGRDVSVRAKNARADLGPDGVSVAAKAALTLEGNGASVSLDGVATVKGSEVKLASAQAKSAFQSRIGAVAPGTDVHVLATQLLSPGGVPLGDELVEVIDPRTDEPLGAPLRTNEWGELRVEVPHPGPWDVRLVHDDYEDPEQPHDHEYETELYARFVDHRGNGLGGLQVTARGPVTAEFVTDEDGVLHAPMAPGAYVLEVEATAVTVAKAFHAHTTRAVDRTERAVQSYVFVLEPDDPEVLEDLRAHRVAEHELDAEEV